MAALKSASNDGETAVHDIKLKNAALLAVLWSRLVPQSVGALSLLKQRQRRKRAFHFFTF